MNYRIEGGNLPYVLIDLMPGEAMISESGGMSWMTPNLQMETISQGAGKALGRLFSGESLFLNRYTVQGGPGQIAFASSFPGSILPLEIRPDRPMICQKSSFLCSTDGVTLSVHFNEKLGAGFFGGEGFIMQRLDGQGMAFIEIDGSSIIYDLQPGQTMVVNTGNLAAMEATCSMDIQRVRGVKNVIFGGEGLFNTIVTGPGRIYLQSMPLPGFASAIAHFLPHSK